MLIHEDVPTCHTGPVCFPVAVVAASRGVVLRARISYNATPPLCSPTARMCGLLCAKSRHVTPVVLQCVGIGFLCCRSSSRCRCRSRCRIYAAPDWVSKHHIGWNWLVKDHSATRPGGSTGGARCPSTRHCWPHASAFSPVCAAFPRQVLVGTSPEAPPCLR